MGQPPEPTPRTAYEESADRFSAWERRGRGWQVHAFPVRLEPPFRPFPGHFIAPARPARDARRPSYFGAFVERLRGERPVPEAPLPLAFEEPLPEPAVAAPQLTEIGVGLPAGTKVTRDRAGELLRSLAGGHGPVSFELVGALGCVTVQFAVQPADRAAALRQIPAYFPEASVWEQDGFLAELWSPPGGSRVMVEFGLSREFMLPLRMPRDFETDPLIPVAAALGAMGEGELGILQVLLEPVRHPWAESAVASVTGADGEPFFADAPELTDRARNKVAHPLFAAVIRIASRAPDGGRAWRIARDIGSALLQFSDPAGNELMPLDNDGYPHAEHAAHVASRATRRSGMILNAHELSSLVHLPSASVRTASLRRELPRTAAFPGIPDALRSRHVYVAGATQHGKSTFIERMALADIAAGHGVCILDPKGDLVKGIVHKVPESRADDTILLEVADPVPIDFMGWDTEQERQTLAADIFQTFLQFSTMTAGDQWLSVLRAVIYTLLDARGCSFLDINAILTSDAKRAEILSRVRNPDILDYWEVEFPLLKRDAAQPIITRMKQFTFTPPLKTLLGSAQAKLSLFDCMETRKVVLVDLTGVGRANGNLVGQLLVSKIQQAAFRRESQPRSARVPFHLYADEFQNFQTSAFDVILSEAGGYGLCLTLANQGLYQLETPIRDAIFTNVTGGWAVFRIDEKDVANFKLKALPLDAERLAALPPHTAFIKVGAEPPAILRTPPPVAAMHASCAERIRMRTRELYSCPPAGNAVRLRGHGDRDRHQPNDDDPKPGPARGAKPRAGKPPADRQ